MIQPGHGTVLYNKTTVHLACIGKTNRVEYKVCDVYGSVISSGRLDIGNEIAYGCFIFNTELDSTLFAVDKDYYVTYWYNDADTREDVFIFNVFIYMPLLESQYEDYPYIGNWITQTELDKTEGNINSNTNNRSNEIKADIKTSYLGNKKVEMKYCTDVPDPNPRNLFVGCAKEITETIKADSASNWSTPISEKTIYYWYDEDQKQIKVGEEE